MTLGENLQKLRREAGLSQEEVAGRLFVSRQSASKWENDQAEPGVENLKALAGLYNVTMDRLTGRVEMTEAGAETSDLKTSRDEGGEQKCQSWYKALVIGRTVTVVVSNLFSWPKVNFPLDWIFLLVGLELRSAWIYSGVVVLDCIGLLFSAMYLLNSNGGSRGWGSLLWLVLGTLFLFVCTRDEIRGYFHLSKKKEGSL